MPRIPHLLSALIIALAAVCAVLPAHAQSWQEYKPAGAGYRIELPGTPDVKSREQPTPAGNATVTMARVAQGKSGYLTSHAVYQAGALPSDPQLALDNARDGVLKNGKLVSEKRLTIGDTPARRLVLESSGQVVHLLIAVKGNMMYQALYHQPQGGDLPPDVERFMSSFKLVKS
ncbi:hypothetical protein [Reyranella sp. CPCC 100927]|uniref:hypothetical protein n=1 Tax=Reyranella sp. CPCC 100927 TaxID=2599616 RepID=UPI0011B4A679|nr:hypothetical protein [Reyranella sp. CPCC 100927]TWT01165.1 hypothetical protein FQU96_32275 [Reyranella sp. CPCC 100927]